MAVRFACRCGKKMKASNEKIGNKVLCPECGSPVKIPESNTVKKETIGTGVAASELAGDLLRTSASNQTPKSAFSTQNNQISFDAPIKKPRISFDFWGTIWDLSSTILPGLAAIILIVGSTYWISSSIMRKKVFIPDLAPVQGVIMIDGQPLANAVVFFQSKDAKSGSKIATAMSKTDKSGHYELNYLNDYQGGVVGLNKVRVQATDSNGRSLIEARYAGRTTLTADIVKDENNEFNFDLEARE